MEKMYRVAISDWSPYCDSCRVYPGEKIVGDYCPHCQYTYNSLTEVREYADATIAWCESAEEAAAIEASLVPYRVIKEWKPEKDLFGQYLNGLGVKKFTNSSGRVLLVAWDVVSGQEIGKLEFEGVLGYEEWMDIIVSDEDAAYNRARALYCVLNALGV